MAATLVTFGTRHTAMHLCTKPILLSVLLTAFPVNADDPHTIALPNPSNEDTKSVIIRAITKSYVDGTLNSEHVADDCKIIFNNHTLTKKKWVDLTKFHHQIFKNIEFTIGRHEIMPQ